MKTLLLSLITVLALNSYAQNVNIPDPNFKAYLVNNTWDINTNGDTEIQVSEANAYAGIIECTVCNWDDLTGIEAFTALTVLRLSQSNLTSLDVSNNTALIELNVQGNQLTSLNVSGATALTSLITWLNPLTSLDVSNNTALIDLDCTGNQLTSLDVSQNTALTVLYCSDNQLSCLNVKNGNNTNFTRLFAQGNPNLTCIEVDDVAWSDANWVWWEFEFDAQTSFSADCDNACTSTVGIEELTNAPKQLLKIVDLMGRETEYKPNTVLIYVYDDGSTEKVFKVEL